MMAELLIVLDTLVSICKKEKTISFKHISINSEENPKQGTYTKKILFWHRKFKNIAHHYSSFFRSLRKPRSFHTTKDLKLSPLFKTFLNDKIW